MAELQPLLRPGLLDGVSVLLAGPRPDVATPSPVAGELRRLGAALGTLDPQAGDEQATAAAVGVALAQLGSIDVLVNDAAALFARARGPESGADGADALRACADAVWVATRCVAQEAFLGPARPGRIITVAPSPDAGSFADASRAALENMTRTLSVEWARHGVTTVSVALGSRTDDFELAALLAFLSSSAGEYFSGCQLDLRGVAAADQGDRGHTG